MSQVTAIVIMMMRFVPEDDNTLYIASEISTKMNLWISRRNTLTQVIGGDALSIAFNELYDKKLTVSL